MGGRIQSVVRAAHFGLPLVIAIIGRNPARFRPLVDLYERTLDSLDVARLPIAVHSPGFVAETDATAQEQIWPYMKAVCDRIGAERGWGPIQCGDFARDVGPEGSWTVGSPETVARKIATTTHVLVG